MLPYFLKSSRFTNYFIYRRTCCDFVTHHKLKLGHCITNIWKSELTHCLKQQSADCFCVRSLRVNLDMGKAWYSWVIQRDKAMPGTTVRTTTIPEELGRISYLLSDKTGTLTQNEMVRHLTHSLFLKHWYWSWIHSYCQIFLISKFCKCACINCLLIIHFRPVWPSKQRPMVKNVSDTAHV